MDGISLIDVSSDNENSLIDVLLEDDGCIISSCSEKKSVEMDDRIALIDVSSDDDDCLIDVSLEDDDCLISSRSGFACKIRKKEKNTPCPNVSRSTRSTTVAGKKKQSEVSPSLAAAVSHNKRRRVARKKKEDELALLPAAAVAPNKSKEAKRKKSPITVNKKIPQGTIVLLRPIMFGVAATYKTHTYLAGKKAILYGLPGYTANPTRKFDIRHFRARSQIWNAFRLDRVMKPAEEFIKQVECLIGNPVDEVLFITVNYNVLLGALKNQTTREKFEFFKFVCDIRGSLPKSFYSALGLERDMQEDNIPPRSRRYMLLVDNLKVKFANIESSDGHFIVPGVEEILKAFQQ